MTIILTNAKAEAFANYLSVSLMQIKRGDDLTLAMSLYSDSGYETPRTKRTMTARRSVRSQRNDISRRDGNNAPSTCGMVSPTIMQNATMPPNANAHWATEIAMSPLFPKQYCMVAWNESAPLNLELITMRRMVQSTVMVKAVNSKIP